ncbi:hypothetical protein [Rhodopila sp.]|uniref:hypothetical protein n=1 Tax=Rhodopila sp. TaxID=2480087 RepID=UPI002C99C0A0|nr:hypothetical protein [Rhodopila sp.]HVZ09940.1 hypothetical protein [Rhodopila sp.]
MSGRGGQVAHVPIGQDEAAPMPATQDIRPRPTPRRLRMASGVVMLTYISWHMGNHVLGLFSLPLAEAGLRWSILLWQSRVGTALLYGAFAIHLALALRTVHLRRNWRLPMMEWLRLWAGFSLPLLLIGHVVGTRVATSFYGFQPSYRSVVEGIVQAAAQDWQLALLAPGWLHGCLGLWISLRRRPEVRKMRGVLTAVMIGIPVLSAAGFVRMVLLIDTDPLRTIAHPAPPPAYAGALDAWQDRLQYGYLALVAAAVLTGLGRRALLPAR